MNRIELVDIFEKYNFLNVGVEVGSCEGVYAAEILKRWSGNLYLIDVWNSLNKNEYVDINNRENYQDTYIKCIENIKNHTDRCHMLRGAGEKLVNLFEDESLDFVYIDANHRYDNVKQDIEIWYPKVRQGGILAGHDYLDFDWYADENFAENKKDKHIWMFNSDGSKYYAGLFGVNPAVDEFVKENKLDFKKTNEWLSSWYLVK